MAFSAEERFELVDIEGVVLDSPGDAFTIREPVGFSDFIQTIERGGITDSDDKSTTLGFVAEYGDSSTELSFTVVKHDDSTSLDSPKTFLDTIFNAKATDGNVFLNYYRTESGVENLKYQWSLVFQGSESIDDRFTCNIKREFYGDKLRSRFESSVNIESTEDLDGNSRTPITTLSVPFHSERIKLSLVTEFPDGLGRAVYNETFTEDYRTILQFPSGNAVENNFPVYAPTSGVAFGDITDIAGNLTPTLESKSSGITTITVDSFMQWGAFVGSSLSYSYEVNLIAAVYRNKVLIEKVTVASFSRSVAPFNFHTFASDLDGTATINTIEDTNLYLYIELLYTNSSPSAFTVTSDVEIRVNAFSLSKNSHTYPNEVDCVLIGDCLEETLSRAAGEDVTIDSDYFLRSGTEGNYTYPYGSLNLVTTGRKIRGIDSDLKIVPKDLIGFCVNRYGAGWQLYKDGSDTVFKIDKARDFFNETKIITLPSVETPAKKRLNRDIVFNKFESGYQKYAKENRTGSINGFNTKSSRQTPIEKEKKTLSFVSRVVTDGSEIERIKRLDLKTTESDQSDDEIIIVKCQVFNEANPFRTYFRTTGDNKEDVLGKSVDISGGDTITLNGWYLKGQADNATTISVAGPTVTQNDITIDEITFDADNNQTVITTTDTLTIGNGTFSNARYFYFDVDIIIPETHHPFDNIIGVDEDSSVYNIDHTPLQSLIHWWDIIGGGMSVKDGTDEVIFLEGKNNIAFSKNYRDSDNSFTTSLQAEDRNYPLSSLNTWNPPRLKPFEWEVVSYMSYDNWEELRLSLLGENTDDTTKNWGYVDFLGNSGETVNIYPYKLTRNEKSGKTTVVGWELEPQAATTTNYLLREDGTKFEREDEDGFIERQI